MKWANKLEYPTANELPPEIRCLPISEDLARNFNARTDRHNFQRLSWDDTFGTYMMPLSICHHCHQRLVIGTDERDAIQFWMAVDQVCPAVSYVMGCCNTGTWPQNRRCKMWICVSAACFARVPENIHFLVLTLALGTVETTHLSFKTLATGPGQGTFESFRGISF